MNETKSVNVQLKPINLFVDNTKTTPDECSLYPKLTPQDLAPVPITLPRTPPPTPVAVDTSIQMDHPFSKAFLDLNHQDKISEDTTRSCSCSYNASHVAAALGVINKNSEKVAVLYVVVFTLGVLCGFFLI
ncbi:unnamed protein product [Amaranthus hypochondriacus]